MTVAQTIAEKVEQLPPDRQQQALRFVESLGNKSNESSARRNPLGALAGQIPSLSLEDFQEVRREMSTNFPREFPE